LSKGVNLTSYQSPIPEQVRNLYKKIDKKNDTYKKRWWDVQLLELKDPTEKPVNTKEKQKELARLDKRLSLLEAQVDKLRTPKPRHYELTPCDNN